MNQTPEQMLREFHAAGAFVLPAHPTLDLSSDRFTSDQKRQDMLDSEIRELRDAVAARDLTGIADAIADIVYVAVGTAVTYGLPFDAILAEVHRSNMTKFQPDGPVIDADGKIVKGAGYQRPDIDAILYGPVTDIGYLSLPVEVQSAVETHIAQKPGGSLNPTRDCAQQTRPPGAELWWCQTCRQFHNPAGERTDGSQ